jgi:hypothetical protein
MLKVVRTAALVSFAISSAAFSSSGFAQQTDTSRSDRNDSQQRSKRQPEVSELTKENLKRVAASAGQIREILLKDAGLFVELKRWVAEDAADNGQVVEDASLLDEAIFDRLEHAVEFRSICHHAFATLRPSDAFAESRVGSGQTATAFDSGTRPANGAARSATRNDLHASRQRFTRQGSCRLRHSAG